MPNFGAMARYQRLFADVTQEIEGEIMTRSTKCSVCALPTQTLITIDGFLRNGTSLGEVAARCGVTKSSLWRHSQHVAKADGTATQPKAAPKAKTPVPAVPKTARPVKTPPLASQETSAPAPVVKGDPLDVETRRRQALERCELLFREALDGLEAAKEPITLRKGDGSEVVVPGDLPARAAFVRAAPDVLSLYAELSGVMDSPPPTLNSNVVYSQVIVLPKSPAAYRFLDAEPKVVEALPEPAGSLTDGRTPDRGDS
jgi:hypothetical protein